MRKNFVVSIIDFHSNEMTIHKVVADSWKLALSGGCKDRDVQLNAQESEEGYIDWIMSLPDDMEEAKMEFFDGDMMFAIIEI